MQTKKLNLGCGGNIKRGYVNLDKVKLPGVDVVHDLDKFPYPFKNNEFDEILCNHVLEHVSDIEKAMRELYRILKPNGRLMIIVPYFNSQAAWTDPTHKKAFGYFSFDYFVKNPDYGPARLFSHQTKTRFSKIRRRLEFGKRYAIWNWIVEPIANRFPHLYEDTPLRVFPALGLRIELIK